MNRFQVGKPVVTYNGDLIATSKGVILVLKLQKEKTAAESVKDEAIAQPFHMDELQGRNLLAKRNWS